METTTICRGYIGIMENKMETTIVYWGDIWVINNYVVLLPLPLLLLFLLSFFFLLLLTLLLYFLVARFRVLR